MYCTWLFLSFKLLDVTFFWTVFCLFFLSLSPLCIVDDSKASRPCVHIHGNSLKWRLLYCSPPPHNAGRDGFIGESWWRSRVNARDNRQFVEDDLCCYWKGVLVVLIRDGQLVVLSRLPQFRKKICKWADLPVFFEEKFHFAKPTDISLKGGVNADKI